MEIEGANISVLQVKHDGLVDLDDLKSNIRKETVMISVMIANNETGVIQPIEKIGKLCKKRILFHTDGAQAVGKVEINVKE